REPRHGGAAEVFDAADEVARQAGQKVVLLPAEDVRPAGVIWDDGDLFLHDASDTLLERVHAYLIRGPVEPGEPREPIRPTLPPLPGELLPGASSEARLLVLCVSQAQCNPSPAPAHTSPGHPIVSLARRSSVPLLVAPAQPKLPRPP